MELDEGPVLSIADMTAWTAGSAGAHRRDTVSGSLTVIRAAADKISRLATRALEYGQY